MHVGVTSITEEAQTTLSVTRGLSRVQPCRCMGQIFELFTLFTLPEGPINPFMVSIFSAKNATPEVISTSFCEIMAIVRQTYSL